jgi:acetolactate synthase-1/2/3 large subunit
MRVADYLADYVYSILGVRDVFMVAGGGMMFLSDGIACHPHLHAVCTHHEQAAAMAAVSYAKYNEQFAVCYVTTGCGGTNAITGLLNGWQDNIPCLFISGQSKRKETIRNSGLNLRQFGVQEADIITIVQSLTKYAVMINKPDMTSYHLEKAVFLAKSGRPGPVWLDFPLDVQGAQIDPNTLLHFSPEEQMKEDYGLPTDSEVSEINELINHAQRPIIIAGHGVRLAKAIPALKAFIDRFQIPVVVPLLGTDLLPSAHPLFIGRIGNKGDRPGNFAVQNSDLVISIGSRLSVNSTGHEYDKFARKAKIVVVDIDPVEHKKNTVRIDRFIHADARLFLEKIITFPALSPNVAWLEKCRHWKAKYPIYLPEYADDSKGINLYHFIHSLSQALPEDAVVVSDAGSAGYVTRQAIQLKQGQRAIFSGGQLEMGYTLPATIGVCYARNKKQVIGITGDGSFQMNIQELQTIVHYDLPIVIFVWNNNGYLSIRATQKKFFEGRFIGTDGSSGVSFPNLEKIAYAYGLEYFRLERSHNLTKQIRAILARPNAVLCEVICDPGQEVVPAVSSLRREDGSMVSKPLEDMYPFLDREEFYNEMIIPPLSE